MIYFKKIAFPGKYQDDSAIPQLLGYIMRQDKTPHCLIGAVNIDNPVNPAESMIAVSEKYGKYSRIRLHHFILTFDSSLNESYELIMKIARSIAFEIGKLYQIVYSVHEDTEHIHIHFVFNAVSFVTGKKYHGGKTEYGELIQLCSNILSQAALFPLIPVNYHPDPLDIQHSDE